MAGNVKAKLSPGSFWDWLQAEARQVPASQLTAPLSALVAAQPVGVDPVAPDSAAVDPQVRPVVVVGFEERAAAALKWAEQTSYGSFVAQDSEFGNDLLPVIPLLTPRRAPGQ